LKSNCLKSRSSTSLLLDIKNAAFQMNRSTPSRKSFDRALILVDYDNVCKIIADLLGEDHNPDELAIQMVVELRNYAKEAMRMNVVQTSVFDVISSEEPRAHRASAAWIVNGITPHLHMLPPNKNDSCIDLAAEATKAAFSNDNIDAILVLTGDRWYSPLIRNLRVSGKTVLVASLDAPETPQQVPSDIQDSFFDARSLFERAGQASTSGVSVSIESNGYAPLEAPASQRPTETAPVVEQIGRHALEIIEKFFGQYEEVYLTPLLRRLTELAGSDEEPKIMINYLEECGAVWLEKRRGFPHNFTVLLVNGEHQDVVDMKTEYANRENDYFDDYDEDDQQNMVHQEHLM
jgi:uncharacterized LabA/DUF88 family protein